MVLPGSAAIRVTILTPVLATILAAIFAPIFSAVFSTVFAPVLTTIFASRRLVRLARNSDRRQQRAGDEQGSEQL
jgi:hypothetical protein